MIGRKLKFVWFIFIKKHTIIKLLFLNKGLNGARKLLIFIRFFRTVIFLKKFIVLSFTRMILEIDKNMQCIEIRALLITNVLKM